MFAMVSEVVKGQLWKFIELRAGDPILFERKECYICYSHWKEVHWTNKGVAVEFVIGSDQFKWKNFIILVIYKWCYFGLSKLNKYKVKLNLYKGNVMYLKVGWIVWKYLFYQTTGIFETKNSSQELERLNFLNPS
jgi:hypothetical protein